MRVKAWRIVKAKHAREAFSGEGARLFGGRWNSVGVPVVYTTGTLSLAILEMLVHLNAAELLKRYVVFEVGFDERLLTAVDVEKLSKSWRKSPAGVGTQRVGDAWVAGGKSAVLRVPSAVVPSEWNYVLNPGHRDFGGISMGAAQALRFDPRLK